MPDKIKKSNVPIINQTEKVEKRTKELIEKLLLGSGQMSIDKLINEIVLIHLYIEKVQGATWEDIKKHI